METDILIGEIISWGFERPLAILDDGGKFADERIRDTIDNEIKYFINRLEKNSCDSFDFRLMYHMFHPRNYRKDFPFYSLSNHKLRAEFRSLHDEICSYLYSDRSNGRRSLDCMKFFLEV